MRSCQIVFFLIFCVCRNAQDIASLNYLGVKPLLHQQEQNKTYVVNFWATWCAPCIKELPYFEALNQQHDVDVLLVSLDFPRHKESRLLPFIQKHNIQSKVVLLDDADENYWINDIDSQWSGALPATLIYTTKKRAFFEQSFTKEELFTLVESFKP